jgi:predicted Ser/Thr protein kinase
MSSRPRHLHLLVCLGILLLVGVGMAARAGLRFAEERVRRQAEERLEDALLRIREARAAAREASGKAAAEAARLPTVKAAAGTRDALTLAENLVEAAPRLPGSEHFWIDEIGEGWRISLKLDTRADPPVVRVDPRPSLDPQSVAISFDDAPAALELPPRLPASGWPVQARAPQDADDAMVRAALAAAATAATTHAATGEAPPWVSFEGVRDGEAWTGVAAPLVYGERAFLGLLATASPLTEQLLPVLTELGLPAAVLVAGRTPLAVGPGGEAATEGAREGLVRILEPLAPGVELALAVPTAGGWSQLTLRDLAKPLFALLVAMATLALLAIPAGAYFLSLRPPPKPGPTIEGHTANTAPTEESPKPGWGRSAVAQVLDRYPEDRFGKPTSLGAGGMGMVLKLHDAKLDRPIALKIMTMGDADPEVMRSLRRRFLREAQSMATLSHPGLPRIHDVAEEPAPHFVMEFIEGRSLQEVYEEDGIQAAEDVRSWLLKAADALGHAHERGIVHRDIKPDNLMLEATGQVRVIDFGIALVEESTRVTKEGFFVGTMGFISPEQLAHGQVDERADVYSLAATGYFLLSGKYPYTTPQLAVGEGFTPAPLPEEVPADLAESLQAALDMKPEGRPEDMPAFRASLSAG